MLDVGVTVVLVTAPLGQRTPRARAPLPGWALGLEMWLLSERRFAVGRPRHALFRREAAFMAIPYLGRVRAAMPPSVATVFDSLLAALLMVLMFRAREGTVTRRRGSTGATQGGNTFL